MNLPILRPMIDPVGPSADNQARTPWWSQRTFLIVAVSILTVVGVVSAVVSVGLRHNDYLWHYNLGRGALVGGLYTTVDGVQLGYHYPVGRMLINAIVAVLPYRVSRAVVWALAVALLAWSLWAWHGIAEKRLPVGRQAGVSGGLIAVLLMLPMVYRDLDDCGLQVLLLAMLTAAGYALARGRSLQCGIWLALAATYKTTPVLFLPYLLFKRRWKETVWAALFIAVFNVGLPTLIYGWSATAVANGRFLGRIDEAIKLRDPSLNPIEPPKHQNYSLKVAMARYLMTFPPEHPLFIAAEGQKDGNQQLLVPVNDLRAAPGFVQFLNLTPERANTVVTVLLVIFGGALAWQFRRRLGDEQSEADLAPEWAVVTALCAILSLLSWTHHLVLLLPCLFLVCRAGLRFGNPWYRNALMWLAILLLWLPARELLGYQWTLVIKSYKGATLSTLILIALTQTLPTSPYKALARVGRVDSALGTKAVGSLDSVP